METNPQSSMLSTSMRLRPKHCSTHCLDRRNVLLLLYRRVLGAGQSTRDSAVLAICFGSFGKHITEARDLHLLQLVRGKHMLIALNAPHNATVDE